MQRLNISTARAVLATAGKQCKAVTVPSLSTVNGMTPRQFHTSPQDVDFTKDDYVARQFGYRVILASPHININHATIHEYEELDYTLGTNLDILASPEVQKILSSKAPSSNTNESVVFPPEAHVDNGYSSDDEGPNTVSDY